MLRESDKYNTKHTLVIAHEGQRGRTLRAGSYVTTDYVVMGLRLECMSSSPISSGITLSSIAVGFEVALDT